MPGDRLLDRPAGDEEEPDTLVASLDGHLVAAVEHDERAVARALAHQRLTGDAFLLGQYAEWRRCTGERARSFENVRERVPIAFDGQGLAYARGYEHVEIARF